MALNLVEAAKIAFNAGEYKLAAIIKQYAESSPILENIRFMDIPGNALSFNREETLPDVGWRGINEAYSESTGTYNPQVDVLYIAGGDLDVDTYIVQTMGDNMRSAQEAAKVESLSLAWTNSFINGDTAISPKEFNGIKKRATGTQLVSNGSTSGGDVLSLFNLDKLKKRVKNPTHWIMNPDLSLRLTQAARNTSVGGNITYQINEFGKEVTLYAGLPILELDEDNAKNDILPFTESGAGGGTAQCTSVYCVSFLPMMLQGIQNRAIQVRDLGELDSKPCYRTRVEWFNGISAMHGRSLARLYGIKDGAAVA